ncbi:MAG: copper resistance CopC family protein [Gemmatimonadaceae bacterium]
MKYVPRYLSHIMSIHISHLALAAIAPLLMTIAGSRAHAGSRHLALVKSDPANAAKLANAPKAIELWFSQKPNLKLTRIVLTNAKHDTLKLKSTVLADTSGKRVRAAITAPLALGKYDVSWRTLSRDGHAVAGKFSFTIDSAAGKKTAAAMSRKPR